jgi:hypothetical protein
VPASGVVENVLAALQTNDEPFADAGIKTLWDWTHELYRGRPVNGHGDFEIYRDRARRSEIAPLLHSEDWALEPLSLVGDGSKYATHVARRRRRQ